MCQSLFLNKVAGPQACNLIKSENLAQVFFCEYCVIFNNTVFTEHLWTTASVLCKICKGGSLKLGNVGIGTPRSRMKPSKPGDPETKNLRD